jgi:hypothetical protein
MKSRHPIKNELSENEFILFSEDEIKIINKLIKLIHNDTNTIILNESFYIGGIFLRESLKNGIIKELREKQNIDNSILKSFEEKILEIKNIDKNNIFEFNFIWNATIEKNIDLLENYEKITLSRIGFNEGKTKAIIFLELILKKEGNGKIYLFEKENEEWIITEIIHIIDIIRVIPTGYTRCQELLY